MPSVVLNRYRNSISYIFGVYQVGFAGQRPALRARISGTGFVVADGLLATNRHVAEPWFGDAEARDLIAKGATPQLEKLVAYFPGFPTPVNITPVELSTKGDLAVLEMATRRRCISFVLCLWLMQHLSPENWSQWSAIPWACWAWSRRLRPLYMNGWPSGATTKARLLSWRRFR